MSNDKSNPNRWLVGLVVLQGLLLAAAWSDRSGPAQAAAQVANPAEQRSRQIDELEAVNLKMDRLLTLLESGQLQVRAKPADTR